MADDAAEVIHLELEDVIEHYATVFRCSLPQAAGRLRDRAGLLGGLARPRWYGERGYDLATQAAALTHAIAEGQRFVDGNKRVALVSLSAFLDVNGWQLNVDEQELAGWILDLSRGLTVEQLGDLIRSHLQPRAT